MLDSGFIVLCLLGPLNWTCMQMLYLKDFVETRNMGRASDEQTFTANWLGLKTYIEASSMAHKWVIVEKWCK